MSTVPPAFSVKSVLIFVIFMLSNVVKAANVICYYQNTNGYKLAPPEDLNANLCTHINYAFVHVDTNGNLTVADQNLDVKLGLYSRVVNMKSRNPSLKVLLSVGGVTASVFSKAVATSTKRKTFVESAKQFLDTYSFDGLDIDWERPLADDADAFVALLKELREEFDTRGWILSVAVYPLPYTGYNVVEMAKYVDLFNLMCYNYFGSWSSHTGQNAPLFYSPLDSTYEKNNLNVAASVEKWRTAGVPKEKIIVGLAFFGRTFTLADPDKHGLHADILGAGDVTAPNYSQICSGYADYITVWDADQKNPYKYYKDQWLGYDNEMSITQKVQYIISEELGGAMIWHLGGDDLQGKCGKKQGLLQVVNDQFLMADLPKYRTNKT